MMNHEINAAFRARLEEDRALLLPGAANALAARVIEDCGFEAIFLAPDPNIWIQNDKTRYP